MDEENRRLIEASEARLHGGSNSEHRCETPLPHAPGVVRSCGVLHDTDIPGLGGEGSIPKANARLAVESLIAERDRLAEEYQATLDTAYALVAERDRLHTLLKGLVEAESDPCSFDHHGYCQTHGWFGEPGECYTRQAREAVGLE